MATIKQPAHGHIDQRNGKFRVRVYRPSKPGGKGYESFTVRDLATAKSLARQKYAEFLIEHEHQRERKYGVPSSMRMSDLVGRDDAASKKARRLGDYDADGPLGLYEREVVRFKPPGGQRAFQESLRLVRAYFVKLRGDPQVRAVNATAVQDFIFWARTHAKRVKVLRASSVVKHRSILSAALAFAVVKKVIETNPASSVKTEKPADREWVILSDAEYELLLGACAYDPMLQMYVLLLGEAGLRADEALWLKFSDVDVEKRRLTVGKHHRTKNGKVEDVAVSPRLVAAMQVHAAKFRYAEYGGHRSEWLIHGVVSHNGHQAGDRITVLRRQVKASARLAGLPGSWHMHDLRHRLATVLIRNGVPIPIVGKQLRHSNIRTTMKYVHLVGADLDAVFKLEPQPVQ